MLPVDTIHEEEPAFVSTPILALFACFLPERTTLALEAWHVDDAAAEITLHVTSTQACGLCPLCHIQTPRIHSRYTRTLADLPWGPYAVRLQLLESLYTVRSWAEREVDFRALLKTALSATDRGQALRRSATGVALRELVRP